MPATALTVVFREVGDDHLRVAFGAEGAAFEEGPLEVDASAVHVKSGADVVQSVYHNVQVAPEGLVEHILFAKRRPFNLPCLDKSQKIASKSKGLPLQEEDGSRVDNSKPADDIRKRRKDCNAKHIEYSVGLWRSARGRRRRGGGGGGAILSRPECDRVLDGEYGSSANGLANDRLRMKRVHQGRCNIDRGILPRRHHVVGFMQLHNRAMLLSRPLLVVLSIQVDGFCEIRC